jgi:hypothetical protein
MGAIIGWRLRIEEAYPGAFAAYGLSVAPGYYVFEDLGNPLCLVGYQADGEGIFFTFTSPLRYSPAWTAQQVTDPGDATQLLFPCYLPLTISRPPRVGGFLHPHCYGVPGHIDTCKRSQKGVYLVLHTFEGDGTVICPSYAAALYRGRAASHFSHRGQITMKGFPTEEAVLLTAHLHTPTVSKHPKLVPYIQAQLEHLEMVDDADISGVLHDPVVIDGRHMSRTSPLLFSYDPDSQVETLWQVSSALDDQITTSQIIQVELPEHLELADLLPDNVPVPRDIREPPKASPPVALFPRLSTTGSVSSASHSQYSTSEERERSKERLTSLDLPTMSLATKDLHQWVENLP